VGLTEFLRALDEKGKKGDKGFFSTHPTPKDRLSRAEGVIEDGKLSGESSRDRTKRFEKYALR
jgi:predicted Zn-dependent protease